MTPSELTATGTAHSPDNVAIAYSRTGQAPTALVFVQGWCGEQWHWQHQVLPFAATHTVVTLDLAGHGASASNRKDWTIEAFAQDIAAVVHHLRLQHIVLIGHSLGGSVVAEAAAILKAQTRAVIGIDTWSALNPAPQADNNQQQLLESLTQDFPGFVKTWIARMFPPTANPALVHQVITGMAACNPKTAIPTMIAGGQHVPTLRRRMRDLPVPAHLIAAAGSLYPKDPAVAQDYGIGFDQMPGVGHFPMLEAPEKFNALLDNVLQRIIPQP